MREPRDFRKALYTCMGIVTAASAIECGRPGMEIVLDSVKILRLQRHRLTVPAESHARGHDVPLYITHTRGKDGFHTGAHRASCRFASPEREGRFVDTDGHVDDARITLPSASVAKPLVRS